MCVKVLVLCHYVKSTNLKLTQDTVYHIITLIIYKLLASFFVIIIVPTARFFQNKFNVIRLSGNDVISSNINSVYIDLRCVVGLNFIEI